MGKYFKWKVALIALIVGFSLWQIHPPEEKINLGLDLQGGIQLMLEVEMERVPEEAREDATDRVVEVIRNRIDEFGVREPVISKQGVRYVVVQLPGLTDRERAAEIVGRTAHLEFKLVTDIPALVERAEAGDVPQGYEWKTIEDAFGRSDLLLEEEAVLTGEHLTNAWVGFGEFGEPNVQLQFDRDGAKAFDQITFQNIGRRLAIVLDGRVHSAPVIRDRIPNGQAVISGRFTTEEASDLSLVLRAGALPAPVEIIEERTVGPSLGQDSIQQGLRAGIAAALLIFLFMPLYYFLLGLVANTGLLFFAVILFGGLAGFGAALTLPGIAGLILSLGMAVDANILIFERIREEKNTGKTPRAAISAGYHKALSAILDSNITTLVTALILFIFGTGPVKGFAVTLTIGIIASMFSALVITRTVFDFMTRNRRDVSLKMRKIIGATHIPFLKGRFFAYGFSVIVLVIGLATFMLREQENFGVEFTGGTLVELVFAQDVPMAGFREALQEEVPRGLTLQHTGDPAESRFIVKTAEEDTRSIEAAAGQVGGAAGYEILRVDRIGPSVSADLRNKAILALFWAGVGILIYLGWRFEWKFAAAAVIAVLHDMIFTFGLYALSGREINLATIAAILTIMGYSVNDTIVTFDRVRDNMKTMRRVKFREVVDISINQMLSRTILTTATTLLAALTLLFFGGPAIQDFAFILVVGFSIGVYSTIFVSTALIVDWKVRR